MIYPAQFSQKFFLYAFGNTPAVSLTQDLPPEQDADILLLGCGDVRSVLFTCFADNARKIDVTCCDNEPLVQARNVLIYSLLMDDTANLNLEHIWNIYYDWKINEETLKLLDTQSEKLLQVSKTIEQWHGSIYGSTIRFCDEKSLSCIRSYWSGFRWHSLKNSEKIRRLNQLQAAIDRAKSWRNKGTYDNGAVSFINIHSAYPTGLEAAADFNCAATHWWKHGTLPSRRKSALEATHLNPAMLYSTNSGITLSWMIHPLLGFPVCTAYTHISKGSVFHIDHKNVPFIYYLVDCAKQIFEQWAPSFRRAVANKSVIRIFCGDALNFSFTLRNCQLMRTGSTTIPCSEWATSPVQLYHGEYANPENAAPLSFDVVDTSNLADNIGPLNLIPITASLLKYHASSCLYTEVLIQRETNLVDRLKGFFGVDVRTMALLLGLVAPHTFTNATDYFEEDPVLLALIGKHDGQTFARSRLRWRRLKVSQESGNFPYIHVEAETLSKFLFQVHNAMFMHEDLDTALNLAKSSEANRAKVFVTYYNRASFASLLNFLKTTVITDWDKCVQGIYDSIFFDSVYSISLTPGYQEDLLLNMHLCGVDNGSFEKPTRAEMRNAVLASILPCKEDLPEQLCVTIQVPRKQLSIYTRKNPFEMGNAAINFAFQNLDKSFYTFSTVQLKFGSWHEQGEGNNLHPYIEEDMYQQSGTSDMFISAMVPTKLLLQSKRFVPTVKCGIIRTLQNMAIFSKEFGSELYFASYKMTSKNVFVTRYMPGMSSLPVITLPNIRKDHPTSCVITAQLEDDGSKIKSLIQSVAVESQAAKTKLASKSATMEVKFKSPLLAVIIIGQSEKLEFNFPVPVSPSEYKIRIDRNSSCVIVESPLFDPLGKDAASFLFPIFFTETPGATVPTPWTSTRVDLDVMPPVKLTGKHTPMWFIAHFRAMFSNRELSIRMSNISDSDKNNDAKVDIRTDLKDGLFSIFMHYTGLTYQQADFFALSKKNVIQTLIFPSCLRLDLANHTVVLDAAIIPLTNAVLNDPRAAKFIEELTNHDLCQVRVGEFEYRAWKAMMPALVERCRTAATWKHVPDCEYLQAGEIPLPKALMEDGISPICSCGVGNFPSGGYLQNQMKRVPDLKYMVDRYATRVAIAPIFAVPYVDDINLKELAEHLSKQGPIHVSEIVNAIKIYTITQAGYNEEKCVFKGKCATCGTYERTSAVGNEQRLLACGKCKFIKYCSTVCQKADWKKHKLFCVAKHLIKVPGPDGKPVSLLYYHT